MDVIQRLEPVIIELEREKEYVAIVAHQVGAAALPVG
jgi:broad specificity phosphatase PhoE